ncbi:MAG: AbrB/MazE/SpoVT family DNA-binding domain-containing protein [Candidatus Promineifilaceae bacterium]|jgi:AbrB family looped-hinge helix DNA binding protein
MLADTVESGKQYSMRVRSRGQVTLPQRVRAALSIKEGDVLQVVQVGELLVLTPKELQSPDYAERFASLMADEGLSLADLLEDLPRIREELYGERYGE